MQNIDPIEESRLVEIMEQFPELVEELKSPENKKWCKQDIFENFGGEYDDGYGKIRYKSKHDAEKALKSCKRSKGGNRKESRIYQDNDGGWYLTSQGRSKKKKTTKRNYTIQLIPEIEERPTKTRTIRKKPIL